MWSIAILETAVFVIHSYVSPDYSAVLDNANAQDVSI